MSGKPDPELVVAAAGNRTFLRSSGPTNVRSTSRANGEASEPAVASDRYDKCRAVLRDDARGRSPGNTGVRGSRTRVFLQGAACAMRKATGSGVRGDRQRGAGQPTPEPACASGKRDNACRAAPGRRSVAVRLEGCVWLPPLQGSGIVGIPARARQSGGVGPGRASERPARTRRRRSWS